MSQTTERKGKDLLIPINFYSAYSPFYKELTYLEFTVY